MNTLPCAPVKPISPSTLYLGPAKVAKVARDRVLLTFPDQTVWATTAIAFPYQIAEGDTVLAVSQDDLWYVIGVIQGTGNTTFTAPANLEFRAPHGEIRLDGGKGVRIRGARVAIASEKLELVAKRVVERFWSVRRQVAELFAISAGSVQTVVRSTFRLKARRLVQRAEEDVKIDGEQVRLG